MKKNGDWLSGEARPYGVPLFGIKKLIERCLSENRSRRFASLAEFHEFLSSIEFVRAKHGGDYIRVISDCLSVSGAGFGFSCIFGRDGSGCIKNWGFEGFDIFWFSGDERHVEYERRILEWILRVGMYELDASADDHRGVSKGMVLEIVTNASLRHVVLG